MGLPYLVEPNSGSMVPNQWAHRNISNKLSITHNFSRAVNHNLRLDWVANIDDNSLLAVLDGTVAILAILANLMMTLHTMKTTVQLLLCGM